MIENRDAVFKQLGFVPKWPSGDDSLRAAVFEMVALAGPNGMRADEVVNRVIERGLCQNHRLASSLTSFLAQARIAGIMSIARMEANEAGVDSAVYVVKENPTRLTWGEFKRIQDGAGKLGEKRRARLAKIFGETAPERQPDQIDALLDWIDTLENLVKQHHNIPVMKTLEPGKPCPVCQAESRLTRP